MKKYKCHKEVHAEPMTRGDYNKYRGWTMPEDENAADQGYHVVYSKDTPDEYHSWSPKKQFDEGYTEIDCNSTVLSLDFGGALKALKQGVKVTRYGWNGKGLFLYYVPANKYPAKGNPFETMDGVYVDNLVPYRAYIALKTAEGEVVPWAPSISDALAEDWFQLPH